MITSFFCYLKKGNNNAISHAARALAVQKSMIVNSDITLINKCDLLKQL